MKAELEPHLEAIAKVMKMTKINDKHYRGEYGQIFRKTNFGFIPESHFTRDIDGNIKFNKA